jgi:hypothetical protein
VVVTNCFAVEKAVILEMFYAESYFLKYEILSQAQDDGLASGAPSADNVVSLRGEAPHFITEGNLSVNR